MLSISRVCRFLNELPPALAGGSVLETHPALAELWLKPGRQWMVHLRLKPEATHRSKTDSLDHDIRLYRVRDVANLMRLVVHLGKLITRRHLVARPDDLRVERDS